MQTKEDLVQIKEDAQCDDIEAFEALNPPDQREVAQVLRTVGYEYVPESEDLWEFNTSFLTLRKK